IMVRHIPTLAFLPPIEFLASFDMSKDKVPGEADGLMKWFEEYYILNPKEQNRVQHDIESILGGAPRP
ncbi:3955_t:CDS:2, partial [Scutellospora calospora]